MYFSFYSFFIVLRAAVRALVSLAVLLGFTCLVAFVYFAYFYEQIHDDDDDDDEEEEDEDVCSGAIAERNTQYSCGLGTRVPVPSIRI